MNGDQLEALPGDTPSRDGHGYAQEENETVVRLNQRKGLNRWSQNGNESWAGASLHDRQSPVMDSGGVSHPTSIAKPETGTK